MRGRRHAERLALDRATARHRAFGRVCQGGAALPSSKDVGQYFGGLRFSAVFRERVGEGAYSIKRIARPVALELATDIESPHAKRRIFSPTLLRIIIESEKRSEEHTSELQSLMRISSPVFSLKTTK